MQKVCHVSDRVGTCLHTHLLTEMYFEHIRSNFRSKTRPNLASSVWFGCHLGAPVKKPVRRRVVPDCFQNMSLLPPLRLPTEQCFSGQVEFEEAMGQACIWISQTWCPAFPDAESACCTRRLRRSTNQRASSPWAKALARTLASAPLSAPKPRQGSTAAPALESLGGPRPSKRAKELGRRAEQTGC